MTVFAEVKLEDSNCRGCIEEILSAPENFVLSSDLLTKYSAEQVARSIVARYQRIQQQGPAPAIPTNFEMQLYFPARNLKSLGEGISNVHLKLSKMKEGVFKDEMKSQYAKRLRMELAALDLHFDDALNFPKLAEILPKYAVLLVDNAEVKQNGNENPARFYGEVVVVLESQSLKGRITWYPGDSISLWEEGNSEKLKFLENLKPVSKVLSYYEAQIWGPVTLENIQEFRVPTSASPEIIEALKMYGRPIYTYADEPAIKGQFYNKRKDLLFQPKGDRCSHIYSVAP